MSVQFSASLLVSTQQSRIIISGEALENKILANRSHGEIDFVFTQRDDRTDHVLETTAHIL